MNPYQIDTFEHHLWEAWNHDFFRQPVHAQVLEIEGQLREHVQALATLVQQIDDAGIQRELTKLVLTIEARAEDLDDIAEHQFLALVSKAAAEGAGSKQPG
jgi:hypothetical protein